MDAYDDFAKTLATLFMRKATVILVDANEMAAREPDRDRQGMIIHAAIMALGVAWHGVIDQMDFDKRVRMEMTAQGLAASANQATPKAQA